MVDKISKIDWKTIEFTLGLTLVADMPPAVVAGVVGFLHGSPQDVIIGTSSLAIMLSSIGAGAVAYLAGQFCLDENGRLGKEVFLTLIIVIAWIIPLMLVGTIPIIEILKRLV